MLDDVTEVITPIVLVFGSTLLIYGAVKLIFWLGVINNELGRF